MIIFILLTFICSISADFNLSNALQSKFLCNLDILQANYPNQNMCFLQQDIPNLLLDLPYGIYPTDICSYNIKRFNFNKRFNIFPHAIFVPENYEQIAYLVSVLKTYNLDFAIRSGGHCFGPGSLSSGYIIDLSNFNKIELNTCKQTVKMGAGVKLGSVIQKLADAGFAIPTGTCPTVGLTGLTLGGGIGFLLRKYGLTSDSIKSIKFLTADSKIIKVTKNNQYSDLFWALSSSGNGSYGIALEFKFNMYKVPKATLVKLKFPWATSDIQGVVQAWQNWAPTLPDAVSTELDFRYNNGSQSVTIYALQSNGDKFTSWKSVFAPFSPNIQIISGTYLECSKEFASVYTQPFSKARSKFIFEPLSDGAISVIIDNFNQFKAEQLPYLIFMGINIGGGELPETQGSFFAKNMFGSIFMFNYWDLQENSLGALAAINQLYNNLEPFTSPYSYSNLVDFELGNTYLNAYYGSNINRLIDIKRKYDPLNIFKWQQSIPV